MNPKKMALVGRKHPALHRRAAEVTVFDAGLQYLARRMHASIPQSGGVRGHALAAPQVGVSVRLVVLSNGNAFANPTLTFDGDLVADVEGCLSLPGRWYDVPRFERCHLSAYALDGAPFEVDAEGVPARVLQHELDHLDGLLIAGRFPECRADVRASAETFSER